MAPTYDCLTNQFQERPDSKQENGKNKIILIWWCSRKGQAVG